MRIIGGRDYYDGAQGYGIDKSLIFKRVQHDKSEGVQDRLGIGEPIWICYDKKIGDYFVYPVKILFCGVVFEGIHFENFKKEGMKKTFWNARDTISFVSKIDKNIAARMEKNNKSRFRMKYFLTYNVDETILSKIISEKIVIGICENFLWKKGIHNVGWKYNSDGLKKYDFAKIIDPWTAFQEISMFLGGVIPRDANPMVEIKDEKTMVQKHGFDKWSFRKMSEKK